MWTATTVTNLANVVGTPPKGPNVTSTSQVTVPAPPVPVLPNTTTGTVKPPAPADTEWDPAQHGGAGF